MKRLPVRKIRDALRMAAAGMSPRKIAPGLGIGRTTLRVYLRRAKDPSDFTLTVLNFTPTVHENYRIGVPEPGNYTEILNSDSEIYSGSNKGNGGGVVAEQIEAQGREWSINISLPPLAGAIFKKV